MATTTSVPRTIALPGTGDQMPTVAYGTWTIWQGKSEMYGCVRAAIEAGYRNIDCAFAYENEEEVGRAIRDSLAEGVVSRNDLFITTKVWNTHHSRERVKECLEKSLAKLQLPYVDLTLIHWPISLKAGEVNFPKDPDGKMLMETHNPLDTWKGLEDCVKGGLTRNIGLSNFNSQQIQRVMDAATIRPCNLQVEVNPTLTNDKLIQFARSKNIVVSCYAPLGAPGRTWKESDDPCAMEDPVITALATKKGKTPAQVILRWHLQRGLAICVKSLHHERIRQNLDIFNFDLSEDEMSQISSLNQNFRNYKEIYAVDHPEYPFNIEF